MARGSSEERWRSADLASSVDGLSRPPGWAQRAPQWARCFFVFILLTQRGICSSASIMIYTGAVAEADRLSRPHKCFSTACLNASGSSIDGWLAGVCLAQDRKVFFGTVAYICNYSN